MFFFSLQVESQNKEQLLVCEGTWNFRL